MAILITILVLELRGPEYRARGTSRRPNGPRDI